MREFKFRRWDRVHEEMLEWEDYKHEMVSEDFEDEDLVIMQDTGLEDENGNSIYEGDIVLNRVKINLSDIEPTMYEIVGKIKVLRGMAYIVGKHLQYKGYELESSTSYKCLLLNPEIFKVITNIYENPELIKHS